jgi:hypothetical protein
MKEEMVMRVFDKRVLRGIFGPRRDEVTGGWIQLRNEELLYLFTRYYYDDQIKEHEMDEVYNPTSLMEYGKWVQNFC